MRSGWFINRLFEETFNLIMLGLLIVVPFINIMILQNKELLADLGMGEWITPCLILSSISAYVGSYVFLLRLVSEMRIQTHNLDFDFQSGLLYSGALIVALINLASLYVFLPSVAAEVVGLIVPAVLVAPFLFWELQRKRNPQHHRGH